MTEKRRKLTEEEQRFLDRMNDADADSLTTIYAPPKPKTREHDNAKKVQKNKDEH